MAEEDSVEPGAKRKQQAASTRRLVGGVAATFANDGGVPPPKKYNQSTNSVSDSVMQSVSTRDTGSRSLGQDASLDQSYMQSSYIQSNTNTVLVGSSQIGGGTMKSYVKDHLSRMQDDVEQTTRKLELEQRRLYEIDASLACAEQEYAMKNDRYNGKKKQPDTSGDDAKKKEDPKAKTQGTATAAEAREERARRSRGGGARTLHEVRTLEARLEKKIAELNQGKSENDELRAQIDQLRKERQTHDNVFRKLAREIKANAKRLEDRKQLSSDTKNDAEEYEEKKASIAKKTEREREEFKAQCLTLKVKMHDQETLHKEQGKLQDSLQLRSEANANGDQAKADKPKKYVVADEEEAFSKDLLCNRILKTCFLNTIQRRHIRQYEKDVEVFQQAFATIKSSTGISDIEEIVKIFVKLEERNYSLLTYVNTLNRDIESIEMRNRELRSQIEDHDKRTEQSAVKKDAALKDLIAQIERTKSAAEEKEKMTEETAQALADCRPVILNITK
jgi:chromosome segregation ATPase